jgi:hypothetical protein
MLSDYAKAHDDEPLMSKDGVSLNWFKEDPNSQQYNDPTLGAENLASTSLSSLASSGTAGAAVATYLYAKTGSLNIPVNAAVQKLYNKNLKQSSNGKSLSAQQIATKVAEGSKQAVADTVESFLALPETVEALKHVDKEVLVKVIKSAIDQTFLDSDKNEGYLKVLELQGRDDAFEALQAKQSGELLTNLGMALAGEAVVAKVGAKAAGQLARGVKALAEKVPGVEKGMNVAKNASSSVKNIVQQGVETRRVEETAGVSHTSTESALKAETSGTTTVGNVVTKRLPDVKGLVTSRVNLEGNGWTHLMNRHYEGGAGSPFTIDPNDLRSLLQSDTVVKSPITQVLTDENGFSRYVREVDVGKNIGMDKLNNYSRTSKMTVITDKKGNLLTAHPGTQSY